MPYFLFFLLILRANLFFNATFDNILERRRVPLIPFGLYFLDFCFCLGQLVLAERD